MTINEIDLYKFTGKLFNAMIINLYKELNKEINLF